MPRSKSRDQRSETILKAAAVARKSLMQAGAYVGTQAVDLYKKIDPDVTRHLLQLPLLSYSLLSTRTPKIEAGKPDGHPPLIFVHGLGGSAGDFLLMSGYLWMQGRKRSYRIYFGKNESIDQMAASLAGFLSGVRLATGERRVDVVAHSLGGIVARLALHEYRLSGAIRTLVTLGSPHNGTYAARFSNTAVTRELRPGSPLMRRLARKSWPKAVKGYSFWSRSDLLVIPSESARLKGTTPVEMTPFTHYSYLLDPKCWHAVERVLADD